MPVASRSLLRRVFYTGPSLAELQQHYAKGGLIDDRAPVTALSRVRIEAPPATVWRLLHDLPGWPSWVPGVTSVRQGPKGAVPDEEFRWKLGGMPIRSTLAVVEPLRELCWTGVLAGTRAVHRFRLASLEDGRATEVLSEESIGGPFIALYFPSAKLRTVLEDWLAALKSTAETAEREVVR
ncbi:SRPBCC family protein [Streptomyces indicus]|uniref:Polyketide cyclase / dehydrase and lipid transport n=1 Tax=Streptomyces indicus TaxID=417292 RepID=A0A1G9J4S4_9ACTN|nr:SRPBCC family protein [Streptomyces indicus]SDL32322.1 Polyketide cyclase / dehydrase and lipid transport [Streptomyces indicus]